MHESGAKASQKTPRLIGPWRDRLFAVSTAYVMVSSVYGVLLLSSTAASPMIIAHNVAHTGFCKVSESMLLTYYN